MSLLLVQTAVLSYHIYRAVWELLETHRYKSGKEHNRDLSDDEPWSCSRPSTTRDHRICHYFILWTIWTTSHVYQLIPSEKSRCVSAFINTLAKEFCESLLLGALNSTQPIHLSHWLACISYAKGFLGAENDKAFKIWDSLP